MDYNQYCHKEEHLHSLTHKMKTRRKDMKRLKLSRLHTASEFTKLPLWNTILIALLCALLANAQRREPVASRNMFKNQQGRSEFHPADTFPDLGEEDDYRLDNLHLFAAIGHHFNRSLVEEIEAYDHNIISFTDKVKVHFPKRRDSPDWLMYNSESGILQGVPLDENSGPNNFYITIIHSNSPQSTLTLPCTVEVLSEQGVFEITQEYSKEETKLDSPLVCSHHDPVTIATISLKTDYRLSHVQRLQCLRKLENFFKLPSKVVTFHPSPDSLRHDGPILSGPGNVPKVTKHDGSPVHDFGLSWTIGCSSDIIGDIPGLDKLETSALDGSLAQTIGYDVTEWQIVNRMHHFNRRLRKKRKAVPSSAGANHPPASKLSGQLGGDMKMMNVPVTEETVATFRNGRTRVAVNSIRATPVPSIPIRASKIPQSPSIVLPSTPSIKPPSSAAPTDPPIYGNEPPMILFDMSHVDALYGTYMEHRIPNDVFYDAEDQTTWNLELELMDAATSETIPDGKSWVMFDAEAQLIYGVPDETAVESREFVLFAKDSGGKSTSTTFQIMVNMDEPPAPVTHNYTFYFSEYPQEESDNALFRNFGRKLTAGLAKIETMPGQFVMTGTGTVKSTGQRYVTWFDREMNQPTFCPSKGIKDEADLMIGEDAIAGWNPPAREFANKFRPEFKLTNIVIQLLGPCYRHTTTSTTTTTTTTTSTTTTTTEPTTLIPTTLTTTSKITTTTPVPQTSRIVTTLTVTPSPPSVVKSIPRVAAKAGISTIFTIPFGSFSDPNTKENDLEIIISDPPSWLAVQDHDLYIQPTQQELGSLDNFNSTYKIWKGGVMAKNTYGVASRASKLEILIQKQMEDVEKKANHWFKIVISNYDIKNFTALDRARLVRTITAVFGDEDASKLYIYPIKKSSVVFTWHNTSLAYGNPCPFDDIANLGNVLFDGDDFRDEVQQKFKDANFTIATISLGKPEWCKQYDDEITIAGSQGKSTTIIIIAVVVVCLVILIVILVVKCRMGKSPNGKNEDTKKLEREDGTISSGNATETTRIKKGVPIIFQDEISMEPNGNAHASATTPLVTQRNNGDPRSPVVTAHDERIHEETPFTSPSSYQHPMTPPTPIMSDRPPPPYVKSR